MEPGPRDQRAVENRDDVLVYSTSPLSEDLEVTGPITADLFVKSSAADTDFTAKLVDVRPDGFAQDLTEGILRMRYRSSAEHATLINPGQIYEISLDLWATSNVFLRGHSLRRRFPAATSHASTAILIPGRKSNSPGPRLPPAIRFCTTRNTRPRSCFRSCRRNSFVQEETRSGSVAE